MGLLDKEDKKKAETGRSERSSAMPSGGRGQGSSQSVIGRELEVRGSIENAQDLRVDGQVTGDIEAAAEIVVGPTGRIEGDLAAPRLVIHGTVNGDLRAADELVLGKNAKLTGNATAPEIVIESGASMNGTLQTGDFFKSQTTGGGGRSRSSGSETGSEAKAGVGGGS